MKQCEKLYTLNDGNIAGKKERSKKKIKWGRKMKIICRILYMTSRIRLHVVSH